MLSTSISPARCGFVRPRGGKAQGGARHHRQHRFDAEFLRRRIGSRRPASKGGIAQLTKSLAIAYATDGIRVNAIAPGWIATPLTAELQANAERNAAIVARTPLQRWGKPEDLAGAALFLSSPIAAFIAVPSCP